MLLLSAVVVAMVAPRDAAAQGAMDPRRWREDIDSLVATIEAKHPNPWRRVSRAAFLAQARQLRADAVRRDDAAMAVGLMRLVATLGDGHTVLEPGRAGGFDRWFPVRFYRFTDGLFVTAIRAEQAELIGARVARIGGVAADSAAARAARLRGTENAFAAAEAVHYLSSVPAARALGLAAGDSLLLEVVTRDGRPLRTAVAAVPGRASITWSEFGEMFGPPVDSTVRLATPLPGLTPFDYRRADTARPLHLRHRGRWMFWHVPADDLVYCQINFMLDSPEATFEDFTARLFALIDSARAGRLVLDLRYNGGGDGTMARPFVHELIRRTHSVNRPGRLYVLVGRKTFSAAITFVQELAGHTDAVFVGEPPRAPLNHYGDPTTSRLPHSGMPLHVSTRYWQYSLSDDTSRVFPVAVAARFTSADYFAGRDPALAAVRTGDAHPLPDVLRREGGAAAREQYRLRRAAAGGAEWWRPFDERTMRRLGDSLLAAGRAEDAIAAYRLNVEQFPGSWRVWGSLGAALARHGPPAEAEAALRRALAIEPDNWDAPQQRALLEQLAGRR